MCEFIPKGRGRKALPVWHLLSARCTTSGARAWALGPDLGGLPLEPVTELTTPQFPHL